MFKINSDKDALLKYLDEFEECGISFNQPNEYRRVIITVCGKTYNASTYIYNLNLEGLKVIESGNYNDKTTR